MHFESNYFVMMLKWEILLIARQASISLAFSITPFKTTRFTLNSSMNSVFVLAVSHTSDIKKYGFQPIFDAFVKEVEQLKSDSFFAKFVELWSPSVETP